MNQFTHLIVNNGLHLVLANSIYCFVKRKELFSVMTSVEKMPKIGQPWLALRLMYDESYLTEDALGDSMSELQQRCIEVLNTSSHIELFEDKEVRRVARWILTHRHSPELVTSGFFEILSAMMAAQSESPRTKKRQRTEQPPSLVFLADSDIDENDLDVAESDDDDVVHLEEDEDGNTDDENGHHARDTDNDDAEAEEAGEDGLVIDRNNEQNDGINIEENGRDEERD
jgi:hypothetical protein